MDKNVSAEQIRAYRLKIHNLAAPLPQDDLAGITAAAAVCGLQNSPPGAWETAMFNRLAECNLNNLHAALYANKSLLQAWSLRGVPLVFPSAQSDIFLAGLQAQPDEQPWIYTRGITLALDFLQMSFAELWPLMQNAALYLNEHIVSSKETLDSTLAAIICPQLPPAKQTLWQAPSMYDSKQRQTVGGAVVSFLLRPCALAGLVVFAERQEGSPSFTSYQNWLGRPWQPQAAASQLLVRKFLHCYGPSTQSAFQNWLGCSPKQARRLWQSVSAEMEPVQAAGQRAYMLTEDMDMLFQPAEVDNRLLLLGAHDPYLESREHDLLLPDKPLQKKVWRTVANPGAIVQNGEIIGIWQSKNNPKDKITITLSPFRQLTAPAQKQLQQLAERYAAFRQRQLHKLQLSE